MENKNKEFEWSQFCRLGEMIGDGLHHEEPWISREYKRLQKILLPETQIEKDHKRKLRRLKNNKINNLIKDRLEIDKCKCGSTLKQTRSGSRVVKCTSLDCNKRYKYNTK